MDLPKPEAIQKFAKERFNLDLNVESLKTVDKDKMYKWPFEEQNKQQFLQWAHRIYTDDSSYDTFMTECRFLKHKEHLEGVDYGVTYALQLLESGHNVLFETQVVDSLSRIVMNGSRYIHNIQRRSFKLE